MGCLLNCFNNPTKHDVLVQNDTLEVLETPSQTSTTKRSKSVKDSADRSVFDYYQILDNVLGEGTSSVVKEGKKIDTGQLVAVKILKTFKDLEDGKEREEAFFREISMMKRVDHPHCLKLFDFFEDNNNYYVVTECLYGNELFTSILEQEGGKYAEGKCPRIVSQVLTALAYLHDQYICHCDIKPENLRFTNHQETTIKIIDFGEATSFKSAPMVDWAGTPNYMAPEIINHEPYNALVDLWSLGVVVYVMLCGTFPFDNADEEKLYVLIRKKKYKFYSPDWDGVSDKAKDFVSKLLADVDKRMNAKQALMHDWLK